jgi:hypothetical protein
MGLSDGARIDLLRRANAGLLSTEQIVLAPHVDKQKWLDLGDNLNRDKILNGVKDRRFNSVNLIDDLNASGTTFLRKKPDWKGKLVKFRDALKDARERIGQGFPVVESYALHVHHYISTEQARNNTKILLDSADREFGDGWFGRVQMTEGVVLSADIKLSSPDDDAMLALCDKYYDHSLFTRLERHALEAGQMDMRYGSPIARFR